MPSYEYRAVDAKGHKKHGALVADDENQASRELRKRGLFPVSVIATSHKLQEKNLKGKISSGRLHKLNSRDLSLMTRQLAVLIRAGLPVETALQAFMESDEKSRIKSLCAQLLVQIREGHSLADAMSRMGSVFPEYFSAVIASGERTGELAAVLERLADYVESRQEAQSRAATALIYPVLVIVVSLGVAALLLTFVAPEITRVFQKSGQPLPGITLFMLSVGEFLGAYGLYLLLFCAVLLQAFLIIRRFPGPRRALDAFALRMPLSGQLIRGRNAALFLRAFSIVMASRVPVVEGLELANRVLTNGILSERAGRAVNLVREGMPLAASLGKQQLLPSIAIILIEDGERSGHLEQMLDRAASMAERNIEISRKRLLALIEPLMMLLVGGLVLLIVIAILLPIFDLQSALMI